MKLYVGNLPYTFSKEDLEKLFSTFGTVKDVTIISDRETGQSRGFGFVTMETRQQGQAAVDALNGRMEKGRKLLVNEARPQENNRDRGHGRGGDFGGGHGGGHGGGREGGRGGDDRRRRPRDEYADA